MQTIDRISQLEQSERDALLRALLTVFDRADCRGRVLASQELPSLLAQAGFDAALLPRAFGGRSPPVCRQLSHPARRPFASGAGRHRSARAF